MIVALAGGVGGAKLAEGLAGVLPPGKLTVVVNTGDDFEHLGLRISPDLDTVMYTLAGINDRTQGWGLAGESWAFMDALERLGGETWFRLGDRDMATHVERTRRLRSEALSDVTTGLARALGVMHPVVPMTDDPVATMVDTDEGLLAFQHYFVRRRCEPGVRSIRFDGIEQASPAAAFVAALARPDLEAVIICPSNPLLSIKPILDLPSVRDRLARLRVPIVAVSPIIGGKAVKGPAARNMTELGLEPSCAGVAAFYHGLIDGLVVDAADAGVIPGLACAGFATATLMGERDDRIRLAREVLDFAACCPVIHGR